MPSHRSICDAPIRIHAGPEDLSAAVAERWIALADRAIAERGLVHVALSGGTTPRRLYQRLAAPECRDRVDWSRVRLWFGDERAVPPEHPESNFRMVRETLLAGVPLDPGHIKPMLPDPARLAADARRYAALVRAQLPPDAAGTPVFDLILLGMGADGHTCSLFAGTPILEERAEPVASVEADWLQTARLSLTYPVLDAARQLLFLVAGGDKAAMLHRVCREPRPDAPVPVERIRPRGAVEWHLDRAAAAGLDGGPPPD